MADQGSSTSLVQAGLQSQVLAGELVLQSMVLPRPTPLQSQCLSQKCLSQCCRMGWAAEGQELPLARRAGGKGRAQHMMAESVLVALRVAWSVGSPGWREESPLQRRVVAPLEGLWGWELSRALRGRDVLAQAGV